MSLRGGDSDSSDSSSDEDEMDPATNMVRNKDSGNQRSRYMQEQVSNRKRALASYKAGKQDQNVSDCIVKASLEKKQYF